MVAFSWIAAADEAVLGGTEVNRPAANSFWGWALRFASTREQALTFSDHLQCVAL